MKIARSSTMEWHRNALHIRAGAGLQLKRLLTGMPGTPENYMCNIAKNEGDYASPRHRHNFDQIRIALEGDMRISPNQVVKQGQIGYFPEGTYYGPYDDAGRARTTMIVQFGGASGSGYMGDAAEKTARDSLLKEGEFRDGIFHRTSGEGRKNQDAYEAVWERCMGRKLEYPKQRYDMPVVLDPNGFAWRPTGDAGVSFKRLGTFTERETRLDMIRLEKGASWTVPAEAAIRILFVLEGSGKCTGEAYDRHAAIEAQPDDRPVFVADSETEIICLVMPLLAGKSADTGRRAA